MTEEGSYYGNSTLGRSSGPAVRANLKNYYNFGMDLTNDPAMYLPGVNSVQPNGKPPHDIDESFHTYNNNAVI